MKDKQLILASITTLIAAVFLVSFPQSTTWVAAEENKQNYCTADTGSNEETTGGSSLPVLTKQAQDAFASCYTEGYCKKKDVTDEDVQKCFDKFDPKEREGFFNGVSKRFGSPLCNVNDIMTALCQNGSSYVKAAFGTFGDMAAKGGVSSILSQSTLWECLGMGTVSDCIASKASGGIFGDEVQKVISGGKAGGGGEIISKVISTIFGLGGGKTR